MIDVHQTKFAQQIYRCIELADRIIPNKTTFMDIVYKLQDKSGKATLPNELQKKILPFKLPLRQEIFSNTFPVQADAYLYSNQD